MSSSTPSIEHVIVVMLENRSYDNILGWLYNSNNTNPTYRKPPPGQAHLNGLKGNEYNFDSSGARITVANQIEPTKVSTSTAAHSATTIPALDPGEQFDNMAQQITGSTSIPKTNPYATWPPADTSKLMMGFVYNYEKQHHHPNPQDVMNYFSPEQLPVTAYLANNFAVSDCWHASLPTQTFSNRVFAHCAAPGVAQFGEKYFSLVDDEQYITDSILYPMVNLPTVFQALDADPPTPNDRAANWKVYFHDYSISILTTPYVAAIAKSTENNNIATYDTSDWGSSIPKQLKSVCSTFMEDIQNGTLPPYSFIEPRYSNTYTTPRGGVSISPAPNSNHPGASAYLTSHLLSGNVVTDENPPIDVSSGELFLMQLYNTLRNSTYWDKSLLIITYDECGGTYDHAHPPESISPGTINWIDGNGPFETLPAVSDMGDNTADGFALNAYGTRVPAIVVSPFVAAGTKLASDTSYPFDHCSIVRTVLDVFGQSGKSLTGRDAGTISPSVINSPNICAANNNPAGPFTGTIVAAPSSLVFSVKALEDRKTQLLQASAGAVELTATSSTSGKEHDWLKVTSTQASTSTYLVLSVEVDAKGLHNNTYQEEITITGSDITALKVPVTMIISGHW